MKKENKEQVARIRQMERKFVQASSAVRRLSAALEKYVAAQDSIKALNDYYSSKEWRLDFEDDEAGLLPDGLKRGVLSEDGIWNLLSDCQELQILLKETAEKTLA